MKSTVFSALSALRDDGTNVARIHYNVVAMRKAGSLEYLHTELRERVRRRFKERM